MNDSRTPYSPPREIASIDECYFYHSVDVPGHGPIRGQWDLRGKVSEYLGHIELKGKRVLELGTASGFLCFEMEKAGADVVAYDLSEDQEWDLVPYSGFIPAEVTLRHKAHIRALNNAWWFLHRAMRSRARMVYGSVYHVPEEIGPVHVSTFGSILLHLRDPFLALQRAAALTTETVVVTDLVPVLHRWRNLFSAWRLLGRVDRRLARYLEPGPSFLPDPVGCQPTDAWWALSPELTCRFLQILGFPDVRVTYHRQQRHLGEEATPSRSHRLFTVVGRRRSAGADVTHG
jgi:hypothetical protein